MNGCILNFHFAVLVLGDRNNARGGRSGWYLHQPAQLKMRPDELDFYWNSIFKN